MSTDDFRQRRILTPQNERQELVPGLCAKCRTALVLRRELVDIQSYRRHRVKVFRVRDTKCPGCGEWLEGVTEHETQWLARHPDEMKEGE